MKLLAEGFGLKMGVLPVDLNTAAVTGERISLAKGKKLAIVCQLGDSTAALVRPTLRQHSAATGGTSKDLSVANPYYYKNGAATSFTKVEPSSAAALYNLDTLFGGDEGIVVFEVHPEDLDVNGNFTHVSVDFADSTAAKLCSVLYVLDSKEVPAYSLAL